MNHAGQDLQRLSRCIRSAITKNPGAAPICCLVSRPSGTKAVNNLLIVQTNEMLKSNC